MKHSVLMPFNFSTQTVMAEVLRQSFRVESFGLRYFWSELFDGARYRFVRLLDDLNWAAENGTKIVIMPIDKTFSDTNPALQGNPMPHGLEGFAVPNRAGGFTALRWNPIVRDKFFDLITHLSWLNGHPGFGGIMLQETALGLPVNDYPDYTAAAYVETYQHLLTTFPKMYWQANYIAEGQTLIGATAALPAVQELGGRLGGPDLLFNDETLVRITYPEWDKARKAGTKTFVGISPPCYTQGMTLQKLVETATTMGFDELFWTYKPYGKPNISDALKLF